MADRHPDPRTPTVTFTEREGFLEARLGAADSQAAVMAQFEEILGRCTDRKPPRLLIDFGTSLPFTPTTLQRYDYGMMGARLAPYVGRVAVLAPTAFIDSEKIGVTAARNRGLKVDIFSDREAALAWLKS